MYKNAIKMPVLDRSTSVASVAVRTSLDRFLAVFSSFGPVFFCIFHIRQPVAVAVHRNRVIKSDRTGLLNTTCVISISASRSSPRDRLGLQNRTGLVFVSPVRSGLLAQN